MWRRQWAQVVYVMFDTVIGLVGLATDVGGPTSKSFSRSELRLGARHESVRLIQDQLHAEFGGNETRNPSFNQLSVDDVEEIALQLFWRLSRLSEYGAGTSYVVQYQFDRISYLTEHMKANKHDYHTQRGLVLMVEKRKRLLKYLQRTAQDRYQDVIKRLGLRK